MQDKTATKNVATVSLEKRTRLQCTKLQFCLLFARVWNLICHIKRRTKTENIPEEVKGKVHPCTGTEVR